MMRPSNARSPHTAAWSLVPEEDLALKALPMKVRLTLTERSEGVLLPPSEVLSNVKALGSERMLLTLILILRMSMLEAYGEEHPSIGKLSLEIANLTPQETDL